MRTSFFILLVLLTNACLGQTVDETVSMLEKKDLNLFKSFIKEIKPNSHCRTTDEASNHQILPGYRELITPLIQFESPDGNEASNCISYQINILSKLDEIIHYSILVKDYSEGKGYSLRQISTYTNEAEFQLFLAEYERRLYRKINPSELFETNIVYGAFCGIAGTSPSGRDSMDIFVEEKNTTRLFHWITSPNFETKLYGYQGYKYLIEEGYQLNEKERTIIDSIRNFKGFVQTCGGCLYQTDGFGKMVQEIKTQKKEYIKISKKLKSMGQGSQKQNSNHWNLIIGVAFAVIVGGFIYKAVRT